MDLRKTIKDRMEQLGINVPELARRIECNFQTLYNYFGSGSRKRTEISAAMVSKVLDALDMEVRAKKKRS